VSELPASDKRKIRLRGKLGYLTENNEELVKQPEPLNGNIDVLTKTTAANIGRTEMLKPKQKKE